MTPYDIAMCVLLFLYIAVLGWCLFLAYRIQDLRRDLFKIQRDIMRIIWALEDEMREERRDNNGR